ncbi:MAG: DUF11 domain-containing protein [bacterium]|nr:DUF11 domain-containing protein [bacterium]
MSIIRARPVRAAAAFLTLIGALVLVQGGPDAEAAGDGLSITMVVDDATITQGANSTWTLTIETDPDVTVATGIVVTDSLPDGLCPYGAGDPDCAAGVAPSVPYSAATENLDGSWTLVWNLPDMGPAEQATIAYSTLTRTHYQEGFIDDTPVLSRDSWTNTAHVDGDVDSVGVGDNAAAAQTAAGVVIAKEVASRPAVLVQPGVCGSGSGLTWNSGHADGYRVGDQVCWRLSVDYPDDLVTLGSAISDTLPAGQEFTGGDTWSAGANNTVLLSHIDDSSISTGDNTLLWVVGDGSGYVSAGEYLEIVFSSTIVDPLATSSGQNALGVMDHSHRTTSGGTVHSNSGATVQVLEPQVSVVKGVIAVNNAAVGVGNNVDGAQVKEGDVVTYQVTVANSGDIDAAEIVVWDSLPSVYAPCGGKASSISGGGVCVDVANRVEWDGSAALALPAGGSDTVTYDVTIPSGLGPGETFTNTAGVRTFQSTTNNGTGTFTYVPAANIDNTVGGENTDSAYDTSHVVTPTLTISMSQTSAIDEPGNAVTNQATIGEVVSYTTTVMIPEGTTVYDSAVVVDLPTNLDLVSSAHTFDGEVGVTRVEDGAADAVTVEFADPSYGNATGSGDDTLTLSIAGRVIDIPANGRGDLIPVVAELTWLNQDVVPQARNASVSTRVVEPLLSVSKDSVDSIGNNGVVVGNEIVDYTITLSNSGSSNVSTAHDLVVVDTLPEGVTPTAPVPSGWVVDGIPGDGIGGTITWNIASLGPGTSLNRTYRVVVDDPVIVSSTFVSNVVVDASSMSGASSVERTGGNGYHDADGHILNTPLASIAKTVAPSTATIGDTVTYTVDVAMPPGTIMYDATVLETLSNGLVFDGLVSSSCDMAGAPCDPMITAAEIGVVGTTAAAFFLGDIDSSSVTGETRVVSIAYEAHLADSGDAGDSRSSSAAVYGNQVDRILGTPATPPSSAGFDVSVGPTGATVRITEPSLTIDKDVSGQAGDSDHRRAVPGESLTYTVETTNSSAAYTSAAHDIVIVDTVPENMTVTLPIANSGVWLADPIPSNGIGGTITWTVPGPLAAGSSVSHTYTALVDATLDSGDESPAGPELVGSAAVPSYFAAPETYRNAHPTHTFRNYDNVVADVTSVELDLASVGSNVWFDVDADGVADPGEPPLAGIDVTITYLGADTGNSGDDEIHATTTAADGSYLVEDLPGGLYTVIVDTSDLPPGFTPSFDLDDGTLSPDDEWGVGTLDEDEDKLNVDFGYTGMGTIGGAVWFDSSGDGLIDVTEYGLEGIGVVVTWLGLDDAPGGDDVVYRTATDETGGFVVSNLPAGVFTVGIDPATLPAGVYPTVDSDGVVTANVATVALGAAEDDLAQDFGYAGNGVIGDRVWLDSDGSGAQNVGEAGLVGVPIRLTWPGEDGVLGGGDDEPFLVVSIADGLYEFENMPPGEYRLEVLGGLPTAASNTFDVDGGGDSTAVVNLADPDTRSDIDFGYQGAATIGDMVWWDMNENGVLDAGEPGLGEIDISLVYAGLDGVFGTSDDLAFATRTDTSGNYVFTDLPAGNYRISVAGGVPGGMEPTFDEDGGLDEANVVTGLSASGFHLTSDFGYNGTGSIGDYVWLDLDADGVQGATEPGIPGVGMDLTWYGVDSVPSTGDEVVLSTTTDVDGNYAVSGLPAGGYEVAVDGTTLPAGVAETYDADGLASSGSSSLVLGGGLSDLDQDFGYNGGGSIGDTVWFDRDSSGLMDADEYGLAGVDVSVVWAGPDALLGNADDEAFVMVTDAGGSYGASSLPPGNYAVIVDIGSLPAGMVATHDADGTFDSQTLLVLADGESYQAADFGYRGDGDIGDLVWLDLNGDGGVDFGEPGIPDQKIRLVAAGVDGLVGTDDDEQYLTTSDPAGTYSFGNLPPGVYEVEVAGPITVHAVNTGDRDGNLDSLTEVALADGDKIDSVDFGYRGSAEIGDLVWLDLDSDGIRGSEEPGLAGVELTVLWHGDDAAPGGGDDLAFPTLVTDPGGAYVAASLPSGTYAVAVADGVPLGLVNTADEDGDNDGMTVVAGIGTGVQHSSTDFGYGGIGAAGDAVWWDLNGDGLRSDNEPGFSDVEIAAIWAGFDGDFDTADDAVFSATTGVDGSYLLAGLPPGDYQLRVDTTEMPPGVGQSADPDPMIDSSSAVTIGPSESNLEQDFGYRGEGVVGGVVWHDYDSDGVRDPGEPGVSGIALQITYLGLNGERGGDDDVSFLAATDDQGAFSVLGMPSGFFEVTLDEVTLSDGLALASDSDGGDPAVTVISVGAAGVVDTGFAVVGDATIRGTVWNDRDGDEMTGPAEVGVAGAVVSVSWQAPTGAVTMQTTSDAFGKWQLDQLPPGIYLIDLDPQSLPLGMAPTTGLQWPVVLEATEDETLDFGVALMLDVGSTVWVDNDGDGMVDVDEAGVSDVLVNLYDEIGSLVAIAETDQTGSYGFGGMRPGIYEVKLITDSVPNSIHATFDRDGRPDLATVVDLTVGADVLDANFGFQTRPQLPNTGLEIESFVLFGGLFLVAGAFLIAAPRIRVRRSRTRGG